MTGYTNPDNLPFPDTYSEPADSPTALQALAQAVQAALDGHADVARQILAGNGLTGGGDLSVNRTINVGAGTGISVAADSVGLNLAYTDGRYAGAGHTHAYAPTSHNHDAGQITSGTLSSARLPFKFGRPATVFPIGADQSTGNIQIAHGLGRTPIAVFVSADDDGGDCTVFASVESFDATYLYAQMRNIGGAETGVYINWIAF